MAKRGVNDQYGNFSEANENALEWEFVGLNFASASFGLGGNLIAFAEGGGADGYAAKKGGGSTSTGGTTSGGTGSGGSTSTGTTTTTSTTDVYPNIPIHWNLLKPPTGDSALPTDTYFSQEAGLSRGTGQINVVKAWQNYSGVGVKIGVVDDGFDYNHPDLQPHYLFALDYDARTGASDAFGDPSSDKHGTTVAGVIGGARDGNGIVGVAYNAGIAGFRVGFGSNGTPSQYADAFNHALSNGMDVANASWGYNTAFQDNYSNSYFSTSKAAILTDVINGRGGLGMSIVFAAGNNRSTGDNVNYHNYQNDPHVITVAGTDYYGHITSISTPGAALLVAAPYTAMTDDRLGSYGYSSGDEINISGTSYSAPYVSGIVALMLQANPNLGYRDVMEVLAYSAKNSDPTNVGWQINGAHDWNGGGLHYSTDYGFGLVDATAAVRLAESWIKQSTFADMSVQTISHTDNAVIPDGADTLQSTITLNSSERIDKVVVDLNITHSNASDLTVTLTSPSGTSATLIAHPTSGTGSGIQFETSANTFWGEDAKGNWTLTVTDSVSGNTGSLNNWSLQVLGDVANTPTSYIYTDEFATAADANRATLHDTSGTAVINTAAVTTGSYLDLHGGAIDTIAGRQLQIATDSIIKFVWTGDGNDTIIANDLGDTIQAGRGVNTIVTGTGADTLYGANSGSSNTFVFNAVSNSADTLLNWVSGSNAIDMHQLFASIGYAGTNPIADGWLSFVSDAKGGTDLVVDAHNGTAPQTVVDVIGITPTLLHVSAASWSMIA